MRTKTILITIILLFFINLSRLFYWQIIKTSEFKKKAQSQLYKITNIYPLRGTIFTSDGFPLTFSQDSYQLSIYKPNLKIDLKTAFDKVNYIRPDFINQNQTLISRFISSEQQKWQTFPTSFSLEETQQINLEGVTFQKVTNRIYPETDLAKNIIGAVKKTYTGQNTGANGLELFYNKQLQGKYGFSWTSTDATGKTVLSKKNWQNQAQDGFNLHTSINRGIQYLVEETLKQGIEKYSADSGSVIIIKPQSGAILAMASFSASNSASISSTKNIGISDLFEPGSIFKPLVVAMALDKKTISPDFICTQCDRPVKIGQYTIQNWNQELHPNSSLRDIIKNSDNIGMTAIINTLNMEDISSFFSLLGLTKKTGVDLPGEAKPLEKKNWFPLDIATASFGQGFAINQLQMLQAFNVLANNGLLVHPSIVDHFQRDDIVTKNKSKQPQKIFDKETVDEVKKILKYSVENGTVNKFKPSNLEACAKSGTAQVAIEGTYSDSSTIASYIGFSPCNDPKFSMIVTINNPKTSPWGSSTAAPIWFEIASRVSHLL